jgi:hypothetical protein
MSNKNNSPEQKAAWKAYQKLGSSRMKFIAPGDYHPEPKAPSRRDLHREWQVIARRKPFLSPMPEAYTGPVERFQLRTEKHTIYQLAKLARRIPRVRARCSAKLISGKKLADSTVKLLRAKIAGAFQAGKLLAFELKRHNVGGRPWRDATPHLLRSKPFPAPALSLATA